MERIYAKALKDKMNWERNQDLNEILAMLDGMQGTPEGDNFQIGKQEILARLEEMILKSEKKAAKLTTTGDGWDFSKEKAERVFAEDGMIRLCPFSVGDERFYYLIREQYRIFEKKIPEEQLIASYWTETQQDRAFYCVIERISDCAKIGYIALKDTSKDLWEIAIELDQAYCHQGYGTRVIPLFLHRVREITAKNQFQFLVEVDNIPCQNCMKKVNAELVGIHNLVFDTEGEAELFEEENLGMITAHMKALAEALDIPPRKLLSHVLVYRTIL